MRSIRPALAVLAVAVTAATLVASRAEWLAAGAPHNKAA
jgi:hypothetical protein